MAPRRPIPRRLRWTEDETGLAILSFDLETCEPPGATGRPQGEDIARALTPAQLKVATLAVRGQTNAEIAKQLGIASRTVANHMAAILVRTGATSRFQLAHKLRR